MNDQHSVLYSSYQWLVPTQFNISQACLHRWAGNSMQGRRLAVHHESMLGERNDWSYGRLADTANRLANGMLKMGVHKGDRVAVIMPLRPEAIAASLAILSVGAILVPLSPQLGIDGLAQRLRDSGAKTIIADHVVAPELPQVIAQCGAIRQLIGVDFQSDDTLPWRTLLARESGEFRTIPSLSSDPAILLYTAGTTGLPKGVLHAHRVLIGILPAFVAAQNWYPQPQDLFWSAAEWTTAPGLLHGLLAVMYFGGQMVTTDHPITGRDAISLLRRYPITNVLVQANDLSQIQQAGMALQGRPPLRALMVAGETLPPALHEWARQVFGTAPNEVYGLTEAPGILGHSTDKWPVRPGSLGRPIPGHRIALLDSKGRNTRRGSVGQLALNTRDDLGYPDPALFLSYWQNEALTSARYMGDWFLTGDMASLDDDGYYWFVGRGDDIFRAGSHRISPIDIEDCLKQHPAVLNAAVVPKPEGAHGCAIKAFVVARLNGAEEAQALERTLQSHVSKRLATWQMPKEIEFVDRLPVTADGQLRRHVLRAREQQRSMLAAAQSKSRS